MKMAKQYGLILPGQQKKITPAPSRAVQKPSIFDDETDSNSSDDNAPKFKPRVATQKGPGALERRLARQMQDKALAEDPTVFQYDEFYDEMETKREEQKQMKAKQPKKPKYISKLLETAERRKLENELRVERQVQKEREAEGEEFKDKEKFVTSTYRKKLEEMRKLEEQGKREDYLEAIGDVTKQKDLDGFYRHLYEQKLGTSKENQVKSSAGDDEISYKPISSGKTNQQQRAYRKRQLSEEEDGKDESSDLKKVHLTNNMDADSDFSIDSSTSSDEEHDEATKKAVPTTSNEIFEKTLTTSNKMENKETVIAVESVKNEIKKEETDTDIKPAKPEVVPKPKKDVWKKRTVGEVFDAALQRYFERKAARNA